MSARAGANASGPSRGGVDKAWASGRVLTAEQRARKQDADRKANRFLKKEVQDRLALLEEKVMQLEASKINNGNRTPAGSGVIVTSLGTTPSIGVVVSPQPNTPFDGSLTSSTDRDIPWTGTTGDTSTLDYSDTALPQSPPIEIVPETLSRSSVAPGSAFTLPSNSHGAIADVTETSPAIKGPWKTSSASSRPQAEGRDLTHFLNNLVKHIRSISPAMVCFDDRYNQDVIITAVLKGWQSLSRYQQQCPLWAVLQMVDQSIFKDCNLVERVSVLRMLHKRYLSEIDVHTPAIEGPLPPWFTPQPSEALIIHEPVVDHLTWPRLRERLMPHSGVLTNKFWHVFAKNLKVSWQREPLDTIRFSPDTSLYYLASDFELSLFDIRNWRMDISFFQEFPLLSGDIPPDSYTPMRMIAPRFGVAELEEEDKRLHSEMPESQQRRATFHGEVDLQRSMNGSAVNMTYEPVRQQFQPIMWNAGFYG
ncbi:hypothetical protein TI39_contig4478g00001 [Zymoseptoria brevis]|uniref:Uncharacterized protein n=1 Tax=Zymoseptoria brevis TaxID=1047168 RepID=A0A0F4G7K3_9PEZI|nr:hypothetical protein TI39_contig4478g00001 [Zymoseptoria brevis]